jgi:hypothetical protein
LQCHVNGIARCPMSSNQQGGGSSPSGRAILHILKHCFPSTRLSAGPLIGQRAYPLRA